MGKKKKLLHFKENETFPHLFQIPFQELEQGFWTRGKWRDQFFRNENPIVVELGCGKGEYTVGLAAEFPQKNFIGIDRKGARLWKGAKTSLDEKRTNVAFIRTNVELLDKLFGVAEVDELWITFPDPHPKIKSAKRRLTSPQFLSVYQNVLKSNGIIHLKTDNFSLFEYTKEIVLGEGHKLLFATDNLYNSGFTGEAASIRTFYEEKFLAEGNKICYMQYSLRHFHEAWPDDKTGFFEKVYDVVRIVPYGRVTSYGAIAQYLGSRGSARMVGYAMNASHSAPFPVPAHRVVNRNGLLTGKHHFGSPGLMAQLLMNEGIKVENDKVAGFKDIFWDPTKELI